MVLTKKKYSGHAEFFYILSEKSRLFLAGGAPPLIADMSSKKLTFLLTPSLRLYIGWIQAGYGLFFTSRIQDPEFFSQAAPAPKSAYLQAPALDYWSSCEKYFSTTNY